MARFDFAHLADSALAPLVAAKPPNSRALRASNGARRSQLAPDSDQGETAPADVLPTVNAAKIKELEDRYAAYAGEDLKQAKAQGGATGERASLKDQMAVINVQRRQLQQAIDSEFPHDAAGTHVEQRLAFGMHPTFC